MTIASTTQRVDVNGNGSATVFSFAPIVIFEATDLQVTMRDSAGTETTITQGAGSTNFAVTVALYPGTGSITYPASGGTALIVGSSLSIKRIVPLTQSVSLQNQGAYLPSVQEGEFDYLTAIDQQQQEQINRSILASTTDPAIPLTLPSSVARASKILGFDGSGNPVAASVAPGAVVSSPMLPVVGAASTAAALALLGGASSSSVSTLTTLVGLAAGTMATIAALRANVNASLPAVVYVKGYTTAADAGGGIFVYVSTDTTSADNGGTIIVDGNTHRWYRVGTGGAMKLEWWGGGPSAAAATNTAAMASAIAACGSTGLSIQFERGTYSFSANLAISLPSATSALTFIGAGADETILHWAAGGGITISCAGAYNSVHIRDLTMTTATNGGTTALTITQTTANAVPAYTPVSDIANVGFRGSDGWGQTHYWGAAIAITSLSNVNFLNVNMSGPGGAAFSTSGIGVAVGGTAAATAVVYNFSGCTFNLLNKGFNYGTYTQGVTFSQCNMTGCSYGIFNNAGLASVDELIVTGSQFACSVGAIVLGSCPGDTLISSNLFLLLVANAIGVQASGPNFATVTGNSFRGNGLAAQDGIVYIDATNAAGTITGNSFFNITTGIWLQAAISAANVQSNNYVTVTTAVVNAGAGNTVGGGSH